MRRLKALGSPRRWLRRIVEARSGRIALFWASFLEGLILPVPIEAVLAPYMQMRRDIVWRLASVTLAGFVAAALAGYAIGALAFEAAGPPLLAAMGWSDAFAQAETFIADHGFWALVAIVSSPLPSQIAMLGAGAAGYPVLPFVLAMAVARGTRYFALGALVLAFGDALANWFRNRSRRPAAASPEKIEAGS